MPRSTARLLRELGYEEQDIRDCGLRGAEDEVIYEFAQKAEAVILTYDREFGNILRFPLGKHFGIIIAHFPNELSTEEINRCLLERLKGISEDEIKGNLITIELRKTRIKRKEKSVDKKRE